MGGKQLLQSFYFDPVLCSEYSGDLMSLMFPIFLGYYIWLASDLNYGEKNIQCLAIIQ